jgi:predicted dehydrogenase
MSRSVAVIGTGWAERVQIPAFKEAGLSVVGIAGRDADKAARIAREHGVAFVTADWRDLLSLDCDLISITSPPMLHHDQALAVLEAGKHLLCEKPLAVTLAEAKAMADAAEAHPDRLALVDHELRFVTARLKARELLRSGFIGRVLTVSARVATDMRVDPESPYSWWSDKARGGGILGAIGSHVLDGVRWLLEEQYGGIKMSGGATGQVYPERKDAAGTMQRVTADDIVSANFYIGDVVGSMFVHGAALTEAVDLLFIRGDKGTLVIDSSLKLYVSKGTSPLKEYVTQLPGSVPNRFRSNAFAAGTVLLGQALAEALEAGPFHPGLAIREAATLQDGLVVQRLMEDIRRFAEAGRA